jgi:hypothetical protein
MRFLPVVVLPALLGAQTASLPAAATLTYRGFALAAPYADFLARARTVAVPGTSAVVCNTSRRTAQLMECGVSIRDPDDGAELYLAAYVLEGRVAFLSFGDSGSAPLVPAAQRDLVSRFGSPHGSRAGMWEWRSARERVRLTWRGHDSTRWIYIALWDENVMDRIASYARRRTR